jgi:hypothetical protein
MADGLSRSFVPRQCGVRQPDRPPHDSAWENAGSSSKTAISVQALRQAKAPGVALRSGKNVQSVRADWKYARLAA